MQIEPHKVEPGFIKRWTVQAIALMFRSPITWGFMILIYFAGSQILGHSIWYILFGGFALMFSLELACFTDFNKMTINSFYSCLHISFKNYIQYVKDKKIFLISVFILILIFESMGNYGLFKSGNTPVETINTPMFTELSFCILFGYIFLNTGGSLQIFTYPIKRAFDSNELEAIRATCEWASKQNPQVFLFFEVGVFFSMIFVGLIFPIAGIFVTAFLPCLIYVAFREIFWVTKENQKQESHVDMTNENKNLTLAPIKD